MEKVANKNKYFSIIAGRIEPQKVQLGFLNKKSMLPEGQTQEVSIAVGAVMVPNFSRVWGRRVTEKSKPGDRSVNYTDRDYKGRIEFLEWGDDKGEQIDIRFLNQTTSLDKQYQEQVLKLQAGENDVFITLRQGMNDFDQRRDATLVEMLKHHSLNGSNKSRNPNSVEYDFVEYSAETRQSQIQKIETRREAESIVLDAQKDDARMAVVSTIFGLDVQAQDDELFNVLMLRVQKDPAQFLSVIQLYKQGVLDTMHYLLEEQVLDLETEGEIAIVKGGKRVVLLDEVEGDKNAKKLYLVNSILEPEVFEAIQDMERVKDEVVQTLQ